MGNISSRNNVTPGEAWGAVVVRLAVCLAGWLDRREGGERADLRLILFSHDQSRRFDETCSS